MSQFQKWEGEDTCNTDELIAQDGTFLNANKNSHGDGSPDLRGHRSHTTADFQHQQYKTQEVLKMP